LCARNAARSMKDYAEMRPQERVHSVCVAIWPRMCPRLVSLTRGQQHAAIRDTVRTMGALGCMLVRGGVAGGGGAAGLLLSRLALMQLLLPPWRRMLIGGIALEVLLMSLLAPAFLSVRWTVYATAASVPPLAPSSGEATQRQLIPEAARPRLSPMQTAR